MIKMPGESYKGPLPPLTNEQIDIRDHVKTYVYHLSEVIGERNMWVYSQLEEAQKYISQGFESMEYKVSYQTYDFKNKPASNIIVEIPGTNEPENIIIVGAHYDTVVGSPGADDNASGVAGLLEMARLLKNKQPKRTIRFIAFVNEEPPIFMTRKMGSYHYAKRAKKNKENIEAMFSIESIGYYSEQKGSQKYPLPFNFFYPSKGDFIGFIGNFASRYLLQNTIHLFRQLTHFPSEGFAGPTFITGVNWSDQWSFWKYGYLGIMITDTALYRNPHYHKNHDRAVTLDYDRMARVVDGLAKVILKLGNKS